MIALAIRSLFVSFLILLAMEGSGEARCCCGRAQLRFHGDPLTHPVIYRSYGRAHLNPCGTGMAIDSVTRKCVLIDYDVLQRHWDKLNSWGVNW